MVSLQKHLSIIEFENSAKKRKWEEAEVEEVKPVQAKSTTKSIFDTELQLDTHLPSEWQRCLDIKSGQIYFYNTRTHERTSKDPRRGQQPPSHMSLDLDLNLPCGSVKKYHFTNNVFTKIDSGVVPTKDSSDELVNSRTKKNDSVGLKCIPSWLSSEGDERELVTAVCKRCHMLVMMCKSSPSCPNCKFLHPQDLNPPTLLKKTLRFLC